MLSAKDLYFRDFQDRKLSTYCCSVLITRLFVELGMEKEDSEREDSERERV